MIPLCRTSATTPDDGDPGTLRVAANLQATTDRITSVPVEPRHFLVDEGDEHAVGCIRGRDRSSAHDALTHRLEVSVGRDLPVSLGAGARRRLVTLDLQTEIADRRPERQRSRGAGGAHAWQLTDSLVQLLEEADHLLRLRIRRLRQRDPHRQHA